MLIDRSFGSSSARIDKRGKLKKDSSQNPLKHYYRLQEQEEEEEQKRREELKSGDVDSDGESEEIESENEIEKLKKRGRDSPDSESKSELEPSELEEDGEEEDDDDDDDVERDRWSTSTTDSDEEDEIYSEEEHNLLQEENVPEIDKETHRLALVNMDWGQVKAVDLYVLLSSFPPKEGKILSVAVYPSEFGLKRMEEEAVHGPVGLFDDDKEWDENDDDDNEINNEKLHAYELSRLRLPLQNL